MAQLYLDEDIPVAVAGFLAAAGHASRTTVAGGTSFACVTCSATWLSALERALLSLRKIDEGGHRVRRRGSKGGEGPG